MNRLGFAEARVPVQERPVRRRGHPGSPWNQPKWPPHHHTSRTRVWLPAVKASGVDFGVRMHDLRHAHASWLLAEGSDLRSVMEGMGHAQIQTTQKYLHALPEADHKNLDAVEDVRLGKPIGVTSHQRKSFCARPLAGPSSVVCPCIAVWGSVRGTRS